MRLLQLQAGISIATSNTTTSTSSRGETPQLLPSLRSRFRTKLAPFSPSSSTPAVQQTYVFPILRGSRRRYIGALTGLFQPARIPGRSNGPRPSSPVTPRPLGRTARRGERSRPSVTFPRSRVLVGGRRREGAPVNRRRPRALWCWKGEAEVERRGKRLGLPRLSYEIG